MLQHCCLTNVGMCTISILIVSFRSCFQAHNHPIDVIVIDERYHRGFYLMAIDGQRFSGHLFAPLLTPFAMQIYIFDNCFSNLEKHMFVSSQTYVRTLFMSSHMFAAAADAGRC